MEYVWEIQIVNFKIWHLLDVDFLVQPLHKKKLHTVRKTFVPYKEIYPIRQQ